MLSQVLTVLVTIDYLSIFSIHKKSLQFQVNFTCFVCPTRPRSCSCFYLGQHAGCTLISDTLQAWSSFTSIQTWVCHLVSSKSFPCLSSSPILISCPLVGKCLTTCSFASLKGHSVSHWVSHKRWWELILYFFKERRCSDVISSWRCSATVAVSHLLLCTLLLTVTY